MIRLLERADAETYRQLRLQALQTDPEAFLSTFEYEHQKAPYNFEYEITSALVSPCYGYYGLFNAENKLIGFCQAAPSYMPKQPHLAYLYNLYVDPEHRHQGLAKELLTHVLNTLRTNNLELVVVSHIASNQAAHQLYTNLGFVQTGYRQKSVKYNGGYNDEVEMCLTLT